MSNQLSCLIKTRRNVYAAFFEGFTDEALETIIRTDTRLRRGFGGQVKCRMGKDLQEEGA